MIRIHFALLLGAVVAGCAAPGPQTEGERRELSKAEISALLIAARESGEVIVPSRPEIEGQSGTKYTAEYFPNGSMIYTVHGEPQNWGYNIASDSNRGAYLCRGQQGVGWNCRNIVKVGSNMYEAVGYNTDSLRYKFSIIY